MSFRGWLKRRRHQAGDLYCACCNHPVKWFEPAPQSVFTDVNKVESAPQGFETLSLDQYECPLCGANDRDRLIMLYAREHAGEAGSVLEMAPSRSIRKFIQPLAGRYRCCDLFMAGVDDRCDITDMRCYPDDTFSMVICSHVLEHVHDDKKAIAEICRILQPGGVLLVLVPIPVGTRETLYDPAVTDEVERIRLYGQADHVRMYSKTGLISLLVDSGLEVTAWTPAAVPGGVGKQGMGTLATLYVARKCS